MVAEASGVSRATVGAILGGGARAERYNEETRRRVREVATRLNYRPHRAAQAMRKQRSNLIGIIHFGAGIEAAHKTNLALLRELDKVGYEYLIVDMNWHDGNVERTLEELIQVRVEGVLISHIQDMLQYEHLATLANAGIVSVSINGELRRGVPLICDRVDHAFDGLTTHLLDVGHRMVLQLLPSNVASRSQSERVAGFRRAIERRGEWIQISEEAFPALLAKPRGEGVVGVTISQSAELYTKLEKPVYSFCKELFQCGHRPDAIVCSNDRYALEAIAAGLECGVSIPGEVAVTGYDNDSIGEFPIFGITTAEQDTGAMCRRAVEVLLERIKDPSRKAWVERFDSRLIYRSSCGRELALSSAAVDR